MRIPADVLDQFGLKQPEEEQAKASEMTRKERNALIASASEEQPLYAKVTLSRNESLTYENVTTTDILVALEGTKTLTFEENRYYSYDKECAKVLVLESTPKDKFGHSYRAGSSFEVDLDELHVQDFVPSTPELDAKRQAAIDGIEWKITAPIYPEAPEAIGLDFSERYKVSTSMEPVVQSEYTVRGLRQVEDVEKWMIENHPEGFIGMSCHSNTNSVMFGAIPSAYGDDDAWATYAGREQIVRDRAAMMGCEVGTFDYSAVGYTPSKEVDYNRVALENGFKKAKEDSVCSVTLTTSDGANVEILIGYDALSDANGRDAYMIQSEDMISYTQQLETRKHNGEIGERDANGIITVKPEQWIDTVCSDMEHWDEVRAEDARLKTELANRYFEQLKPKMDVGTLSPQNDPHNTYEVFSDAHRDLYGNKFGSGMVQGFGPNFGKYGATGDSECVYVFEKRHIGEYAPGNIKSIESQVQDYCQLMKMDKVYYLGSEFGDEAYICFRGNPSDIRNPHLRGRAEDAVEKGLPNVMENIPLCEVDDKHLGIKRPEPQPDNLKMYTMVTETEHGSGRMLVATEDEIRPGDVHAVENFIRSEHGYGQDSKIKVQFDTIHEVDRFTAYDGYVIDDDTHVFRKGEATPTRTLGDYGGEKGLLKGYNGLSDSKPAEQESKPKSDRIDYKNDVVIRNVRINETERGVRAKIPYADSPSGYGTVAVEKCEASGKQGKELYNITMAVPESGPGKGKVSVYYKGPDGKNVWDRQFPDVVREKSQAQRDAWKAAHSKVIGETMAKGSNEAQVSTDEQKTV